MFSIVPSQPWRCMEMYYFQIVASRALWTWCLSVSLQSLWAKDIIKYLVLNVPNPNHSLHPFTHRLRKLRQNKRRDFGNKEVWVDRANNKATEKLKLRFVVADLLVDFRLGCN